MIYFKHQELVDKYHVSLKTVHNWIDAAKQGKLELELYEQAGRTYVANNPTNIVNLERLVEQGKKYRNARYHKVATPAKEFYELYSRKQILDIITNLSVHHEIPRQYNYFNGGAESWDRFALHMREEKTPNLLKSTIELIQANLGAIDLLLGHATRVNVIDIGPGNALPVKELLEHLLETGKLHRYIAVDISESMLRIAEGNIKQWFGDRVKFEGHVKDVTHEQFDDLIVDDVLNQGSERTVNLALLLGATPMNSRDPYDMLKVIYKSLGNDDLLIYTDKPDSEAERRSFSVNAEPGLVGGVLSTKYRFIFDLLNIDESLYDVEMGFNEQKRAKFIRVRLKVALTIRFQFGNSERSAYFEKGETILLWRAWYMTALEVAACFEEVGFKLLHLGLTQDRQYLLNVLGVEVTPELET